MDYGNTFKNKIPDAKWPKLTDMNGSSLNWL